MVKMKKKLQDAKIGSGFGECPNPIMAKLLVSSGKRDPKLVEKNMKEFEDRFNCAPAPKINLAYKCANSYGHMVKGWGGKTGANGQKWVELSKRLKERLVARNCRAAGNKWQNTKCICGPGKKDEKGKCMVDKKNVCK